MSDLRDRRAFCRVVELTSFAAAARDLGLPTATVSASVKRLEDKFGVRLLERTTRKVSVTDEGRTYYERISALMDDIADVEAQVVQAADAVSGRVRIAAPRHLTGALLIPNVAALTNAHPELELDFTLADTTVDMLGEAVDIAIRIGPLPDTSASAIRLGTFEQLLCAAPSWIEAKGPIEHHRTSRCNIDAAGCCLPVSRISKRVPLGFLEKRRQGRNPTFGQHPVR